MKTIEVTEDEKRFFRTIQDSMDKAKFGMVEMASVLANREKELWKEIHNSYPETDGYNIQYWHDRGLIIIGIKEEGKEENNG